MALATETHDAGPSLWTVRAQSVTGISTRSTSGLHWRHRKSRTRPTRVHLNLYVLTSVIVLVLQQSLPMQQALRVLKDLPEEFQSDVQKEPMEAAVTAVKSVTTAIAIMNATSDDNIYEPYSTRPETYIVPVVFALIFVVGVLGNGTLVLVFIRHRSMRSVPNTYILSLALGDLLVIITCVPFTSTVYTVESWPYGELICKLSEATKDVSIGVSVFTLTALSAERYCAIVNPIRRHVSSKPFTLMTAVAIWILAVVLATPSATFSHLATESIPNTNLTIEYCYPFPMELGSNYARGMVLFKLLAYYVVPLCVIGCFYLLMAHHLMVSTRNMPGELQHAGQSGQIRARKKVAKMVLLFVVIFMISFLPYHVFMMWFHFNPYSRDEYDDYWHAFRIVGFCLSFINSCVNPVALYFISGVFRKHFNRYLFCCFPFARSGPAAVESTIQDINLTHINSTSCRRLNSVVTSHATTLSHAT